MPSEFEQAPSPARNPEHLDVLGGLRNAAALLVVLAHGSGCNFSFADGNVKRSLGRLPAQGREVFGHGCHNVGSTTAFASTPVPWNDMRLRCYVAIFFAGPFCGLLANHWEKLPEAKHSVLGILSLLGLAFILATSPPLVNLLGIASEENHYPEKWMFAHGLAFIPVLFCAAYGNGVTNRIFSNRFLRFVGMVIFSLYLWHPVFTQGCSRLIKHVNPMVLGWVALVGTLVASYISYRMIEKPFLKLGTNSRPKSTSVHRHRDE